MLVREGKRNEAAPSVLGVFDSQSFKTTESSGFHDYDGAKKIKRCKRNLLTDTDGNLVHAG